MVLRVDGRLKTYSRPELTIHMTEISTSCETACAYQCGNSLHASAFAALASGRYDRLLVTGLIASVEPMAMDLLVSKIGGCARRRKLGVHVLRLESATPRHMHGIALNPRSWIGYKSQI